jgi:hypothetical protein
MEEKDKNRYETLPIPTYEEATSSRPNSSQSRVGPEEVSDDAERQGLLRYSNRHDSSSAGRYAPPTVESARSSLDLPSLDGLDRTSVDGLRQEMQQMEVEEPNGDNGSHRSLLTYRFSKRITSFTNSFSSLTLHSLRQYIPAIKWPSIRFQGSDNYVVLLGRLFGVFLIISVAYVLIASDVISFRSRASLGQMYNPESIRIFVQQSMNEDGKMQEYLEYITRYPHIAGTEGNFVLGEWVQELFKQSELEDVNMERFDVYLNYPKPGGRKVAIVSPPEMRWEALIEEDLAYSDPPRQQTDVFHGHSKAGNVTGRLIYANYGSREDFKKLEDSGISLKGAIALVRYYGTQGDRALKVKAAELAGAAGCIIYSDPAQDGFVQGKVWPDGRYMPADAVQRGAVSLMSWVVGDVLSPGWASTPGDKRRQSPMESSGLNQIPSIPVAWRDAQHLLQSLKGHGQKVAEDWQGGVPDVEWWSGDSGSPVVNLINMQDEEVYQPIYNVLGRINGWEQSEKKIIVGNHRDAWCFGGADPGSGTAVMLEVVRVFGELRKRGWRPLRTIEFASWDGEEYNLIGSTEHVENRLDELRKDGFAYLNVDVGVVGSDFRAAASPLFERALLRVLDRTSDPVSNRTLREIWDEKKTGLEGLGAGSDYVAFQDIAGTSSIDMSFKGPHYPYHSCYDNYDWMAKFGDPDFAYHKLMGEVWALLILEVADRPIMPFDMEAYARAVSRYVTGLEDYGREKGAPWGGDKPMWDLSPLRRASEYFEERAKIFHEWDTAWNQVVFGSGGAFETNVMAIRRMSHNSRMAEFETHLLDLEEGGGVSVVILSFNCVFSNEVLQLHGRTQFKHIIFAPQVWSGYDEAYFPSIRDAMDAGDWKEAQKQVEKVASILSTAVKELVTFT